MFPFSSKKQEQEYKQTLDTIFDFMHERNINWETYRHLDGLYRTRLQMAVSNSFQIGFTRFFDLFERFSPNDAIGYIADGLEFLQFEHSPQVIKNVKYVLEYIHREYGTVEIEKSPTWGTFFAAATFYDITTFRKESV